MQEMTLRADKWLWYARFFKSRSQAARHIQHGKVRLNRHRILKPSTLLRAGDVLTFVLGKRIKTVEVASLGIRRGPVAEARSLYLDLVDKTPSHTSPATSDAMFEIPAE